MATERTSHTDNYLSDQESPTSYSADVLAADVVAADVRRRKEG